MTTAIEANSLGRRFGDIIAVEGLSLSIAAGEIFGLVGPDGAGKTTTLRLLATVMAPTSGQARVAGFDVVQQAGEIKQRAGYMAQDFRLYGDLSVQENLDFFADTFAVRGEVRRARITSLLQFARLTEFRQRRAAQLSGGMKKKLALACSLIHRPEILFLDEPTTGVDPVARREFWDILSGLHIEGVTILVSTPYMDEAERCSRVGLMYGGHLIVCDTPAAIRRLVAGEVIELRPLGSEEGVGLLRHAVRSVVSLPGVHDVQTHGNLLHIVVDDAQQRMPEVVQALRAQGIEPAGLRQTQAHMEEAFHYLIRRAG